MQPRGLGMPAIFAASLAGPWEQLVELLDGHAGGLAERPDGGAGALSWYSLRMNRMTCQWRSVSVVDAPRRGDLRRHLLAPLLGVDEEALVVDGRRRCPRRSWWAWSALLSCRRRGCGGACPAARHRPGRRRGCRGRAAARASRTSWNISFPRWFSRDSLQQRQTDAAGEVPGQRLGVVVEVDQQGLAEAGLDEAVRVPVEAASSGSPARNGDVLGQDLALEVRHRSGLRCRDVGGVADHEDVRPRPRLQRVLVGRHEAELVAEARGALDVGRAAVQRDDHRQVERRPRGRRRRPAPARAVDLAGVELGDQLDALLLRAVRRAPGCHGLVNAPSSGVT